MGNKRGGTTNYHNHVIPTALSDDRFLRWNLQKRQARHPRKKGQWSGPLV